LHEEEGERFHKILPANTRSLVAIMAIMFKSS